ncbi:polysaccharide deacetylase family protein [Jannaschia ovalis]|uniref:Polysaccharide deacetylase n=1 Tax=Jannaschia ovalis TaxID=3038773 RepID=A0ABY8LBM9_9RHOB|nr:hypothetical protein [Jannaschia sp. GRR-S6-38]WGH78732.1 hypothetical protein P8627_00270 [Jannaschia sp. GRR-S6-38]
MLLAVGASVWIPLAAAAQPVARDVLALFDSTTDESVVVSQLHRFVEFPLNHMGMRVSYWDVAEGMPDWANVDPDFVVSWFQAPVPDPDAYLAWMQEARGREILIATIGVSGLPYGDDETGADGVLEIHGLSSVGFVPVTFGAEIVDMDSDVVGFECTPDAVLPPFPVLVPRRQDITSHLTVRPNLPRFQGETSLVTTSDAGGFVAFGFALCRLPETETVQWLIDPFTFFSRAFDLGRWPVPDTTTLSGRRLYFSHIDGDGWNNVSEIPLPWDERPLSAEVINERILKAYPAFPVGVGLIGGDVDPTLGAPDAGARLARDAFALPNVEIGVHGYTHPFLWWYYEDYDRQAELDLIAEQRGDPDATPLDRFLRRVRGENDSSRMSVNYGLMLPRAHAQRPFSLEEEIDEAIAVANAIAPEGKTAQAFYWTGDTRPFPEAIAATVAAGVRNINGGDSRFDSVYPSMAYLSPLGLKVGAHRQIYTANANDNIYTSGWTRDFHGMRLVAETVERTGSPRRLKPFNLYYHTFAGERFASLEALFFLHELAASEEFIRVFPSRYIDTVTGFFSAEIEQIGENAWAIRDRGDLQTLRIDRLGSLSVDFGASSGVIGQRRFGDALYVSLDPADAAPVLRLAAEPEPAIHLVEASWEITRFAVDDCSLAVDAEGFGEGRIRIAGIDAKRVEIVAHRDGMIIFDGDVPVEDGQLDIGLPEAVDEATRLDIRCRR